jgi:hypothetical protein
MAGNEKNFAWFKYVDDQAVNWNVRGESGGAGSAIDGHATDLTLPSFGRQSRRRHVRKCVWKSPGQHSVDTIIYTPAAYAAIVAGATLAVPVPGSAGTITYTLAGKIPEKQPIPSAGTHLFDE